MHRFFLCLLLASAPIMALDHPDFSGTWRLSAEESDFAGKSAPKEKSEVIQHKDPSLTENVKQVDDDGSRTGVYQYMTDGQQTTNSAFGQQNTSTASWDGQDLVIHTTSRVGGKTSAFNDRWTLSLDGSILTVRRHYEGEGIRSDQMLVYHKDAAKTE